MFDLCNNATVNYSCTSNLSLTPGSGYLSSKNVGKSKNLTYKNITSDSKDSGANPQSAAVAGSIAEAGADSSSGAGADVNVNVNSTNTQTTPTATPYSGSTIGAYPTYGNTNGLGYVTTDMGVNGNQNFLTPQLNNILGFPTGSNVVSYPYGSPNTGYNNGFMDTISQGFNSTFGTQNGNPLNLFGLLKGQSDVSSPSTLYNTQDGRQGIANTQNTITGIPSSQIPTGHEDLYILKSEVVPPVCPACPPVYIDSKELGKQCEPCPPCARCPEPSFDCKKVPNYEMGPQNTYLPRPVLNNFSTFGR